jgi:FixJ family two-component response regulator
VPSVPNCLLVDAASCTNAFDLQKRIVLERPGTMIIFMASSIEVATAVKAIKAGAVEFFTKPCPENELLSSMREALERSQAAVTCETEMRLLRGRYSGLSRREREVMTLVVSGLLNKQVGGELGISEITVKAHRGQVMRKMRIGYPPSKFPHPQCGVTRSTEPIASARPAPRKGSAKYCVSWTTLPLRNSIILTVYASRPWYVIVYSVI